MTFWGPLWLHELTVEIPFPSSETCRKAHLSDARVSVGQSHRYLHSWRIQLKEDAV